MTQVIIRRVDTGASITGNLDDDDSLTGGVGGWDSLDRPRNTAAVSWTGTPAKTYTLPFRLDGTEATPGVDAPVELLCTQLENWGRGDLNAPPPVLQVLGEVLVTPTSRWVLQDIAWGARERDQAGQRVQQVMTLTLLEYVAPALVTSPAKKVRQNSGNGSGSSGSGGSQGSGSSGQGSSGTKKWPGSHDTTSGGQDDNGGKTKWPKPGGR